MLDMFFENVVRLYSVSALIFVLTFICFWAWKLIIEVSLHIYDYNLGKGNFFSEYEIFCKKISSKKFRRNIELNILENKAESMVLQVKSNVSTILVLSSLAPLIGLLGTVQGMIQTFNVISTVGTSSNAQLTEGISQALITTQCGLVVAIPTFLAGGILYQKMKKIRNRLHSVALHSVSSK